MMPVKSTALFATAGAMYPPTSDQPTFTRLIECNAKLTNSMASLTASAATLTTA